MNPYDAPDDAANVGSKAGLISLKSMFVTVAISAGLFGVMGLLVGAGLGLLVPNYYRSVFAGGDSANFDPVAVGIGQGLTQGLALGAVVGVVIVFLYVRQRR